MKTVKTNSETKSGGLWAAVWLAVILAVLFYRSFLPDYVHFSNDGPLGQQNADWTSLPASFTGNWGDLNSIGSNVGLCPLDLTSLMRWVLGPVGYAKFLSPLALFILGLGAWTFFRQLRLSPLAALLGGLAAALNSAYFATACWGVASQQVAIGMIFFALALVVSNSPETPVLVRWTRLALAGLAVGMNVMEAADIGAIFSLFVVVFVLFRALVAEGGPGLLKLGRGVGQVAIIALFAGFIAMQTVVALVGSQITGITSTSQDAETKVQHWDWATQWSLPKLETFSLIVPGLYGYKMDTPKNMMPQFVKYYEDGEYWGGVGRDPVLDRYFDGGSKGNPPASGFMRFTGGGNYVGILILLLAAWAVALAFRRQDSPFNPGQKKMIFFWLAVLVISLLFAWGRFAPFYALLYKLPYFSTIRNPCKFLAFFAFAGVVLFAYGLHALSLRNPAGQAASANGPLAHFKNWWSRASRFERRWTCGCVAAFAASVLGWLIFLSQKDAFVRFLQERGFPDENTARGIAEFAIAQAGWFVPLLGVALVLLLLAVSGYFSGRRARLGAVLLGVFLLFDLGRADLPYIIHWDYKQKYEVGSLNPIVGFLRNKPYEHRVTGLRCPQGFELFDQLYRIEWMQHHFPYYNIQSLDIIQMPRMPEDLKAYLEALSPNGTADSGRLVARHWELTNTRYLLGPAGYLEVLNEQLDPVQKSFRIVQRFGIGLKPGVAEFHQRLEELTAYPSENGDYALFEFTGALPRVKLYSNWQVNTNDQAVLKTLADLNFDPARTVLVSTPLPATPAANAAHENSGTVEFKRYVPDDPVFKENKNSLWKQSGYCYAPKDIMFDAKAETASVLLLNDKFDPHWRVFVDGKPADLLRCNFIMRGVFLSPGSHTVEFKFSLPFSLLYVSMAAIGTALLLCVCLIIWQRRPALGLPNRP
jgi:hypothetical protein